MAANLTKAQQRELWIEDLRDIHEKLKFARKDPPPDTGTWIISLVKVLDETLDMCFEKWDKENGN